jgi:hypothetical protein
MSSQYVEGTGRKGCSGEQGWSTRFPRTGKVLLMHNSQHFSNALILREEFFDKSALDSGVLVDFEA